MLKLSVIRKRNIERIVLAVFVITLSSFIMPIQGYSQEKIEDILFMPGYKYHVSWVHNLQTNEDYNIDEAGFVGDAWINVDDDYTAIRITQRLTTYVEGENGYLEADNKNVETTYLIDAAYPAKDKDGDFGISADCKTKSGKKVLVEVTRGGCHSDGKPFYCYQFRDGVFDHLLWCFDPANREKIKK